MKTKPWLGLRVLHKPSAQLCCDSYREGGSERFSHFPRPHSWRAPAQLEAGGSAEEPRSASPRPRVFTDEGGRGPCPGELMTHRGRWTRTGWGGGGGNVVAGVSEALRDELHPNIKGSFIRERTIVPSCCITHNSCFRDSSDTELTQTGPRTSGIYGVRGRRGVGRL